MSKNTLIVEEVALVDLEQRVEFSCCGGGSDGGSGGNGDCSEEGGNESSQNCRDDLNP